MLVQVSVLSQLTLKSDRFPLPRRTRPCVARTEQPSPRRSGCHFGGWLLTADCCVILRFLLPLQVIFSFDPPCRVRVVLSIGVGGAPAAPPFSASKPRASHRELVWQTQEARCQTHDRLPKECLCDGKPRQNAPAGNPQGLSCKTAGWLASWLDDRTCPCVRSHPFFPAAGRWNAGQSAESTRAWPWLAAAAACCCGCCCMLLRLLLLLLPAAAVVSV